MSQPQKTAEERTVLVLLRDGDQVLLIHKKRGLGAGKVNLPGGHVEPGESLEQAAVRETTEETGITPISVREAAELRFRFVDGLRLHVTVFVAEGWQGHLQECDEAAPFWNPANQIPWVSLWADDPLWLPAVLAGRRVQGRFLFDQDTMREAEIRVGERPPAPFNG